jgi:choline dehydrogenase
VALREGVRFIDHILMHGEWMKDIIGEDYPWPMPRHSDEAMKKMILERSQTGFRTLPPSHPALLHCPNTG